MQFSAVQFSAKYSKLVQCSGVECSVIRTVEYSGVECRVIPTV